MSAITDHLFTPPVDEPFERCVICHLSEAAHAETGHRYQTASFYRCPDCVTRGNVACLHDRPKGDR